MGKQFMDFQPFCTGEFFYNVVDFCPICTSAVSYRYNMIQYNITYVSSVAFRHDFENRLE